MRIAYLDCFSGISGDMTLGALVDAGVELQYLRKTLARLPLSGYALTSETVQRCGIGATRVDVQLDHEHEHHHRGLSDVLELIHAGDLPEEVAQGASRAFEALARAEAKVHQTDPDSIHFHEVGAVDAVCDIVGASAGFHRLGLDRVLCSRVALGGGRTQAAHGNLPVPAPATVELLKGFPTSGGPVDVELTTPTGAALLATFASPVTAWPSMEIDTIGYGAGGQELDTHPNCLRLAVGTGETPTGNDTSDWVWELQANLDDMTGEELSYCADKLRSRGALDVYTIPIQMKKGRPAILIGVLCPPARLRELEDLLWRHSTTLGIRRCLKQRSCLKRGIESVDTPWGPVRVKIAYRDSSVLRREPEYEDCRQVADKHDVALRDVYRLVRQKAAQEITPPCH